MNGWVDYNCGKGSAFSITFSRGFFGFAFFLFLFLFIIRLLCFSFLFVFEKLACIMQKHILIGLIHIGHVESCGLPRHEKRFCHTRFCWIKHGVGEFFGGVGIQIFQNGIRVSQVVFAFYERPESHKFRYGVQRFLARPQRYFFGKNIGNQFVNGILSKSGNTV